jgi:RNA polymerase sigma factor (sigma-70 family)
MRSLTTHERDPDYFEIGENFYADDAETFSATPKEDDDDALATYLKSLAQFKLLTAADEVELAKRIEAGDEAAFHEMVNANLRLVVRAAKRYLGSGMAFADLIQEGNLGLMHAVRKFDHTLGWRFSTYAVWWIRQSIERALMNTFGTIRLPIHISKQVRKLTQAMRKLSETSVTEPTVAEVAKELGEPEERVHQLMLAIIMNQVDRLEDVIQVANRHSDGSVYTLAETIEDEGLPDPYELMAQEILPLLEDRWLSQLTPAERQVIELRFGLRDDPKTIEQAARAMRLSKENLRRLQGESLLRLREICNMEGFDEVAALH